MLPRIIVAALVVANTYMPPIATAGAHDGAGKNDKTTVTVLTTKPTMKK